MLTLPKLRDWMLVFSELAHGYAFSHWEMHASAVPGGETQRITNLGGGSMVFMSTLRAAIDPPCVFDLLHRMQQHPAIHHLDLEFSDPLASGLVWHKAAYLLQVDADAQRLIFSGSM